MTRPPCDHTEDDGTPCPSWAITGYDRCVRHWQPGIGPKRLHAPAYSGVYREGSHKLDRPVRDEPAPPPAESTEPAATATLDAEWGRIREEALDRATKLAPNPPSRRGWRRLFRWAA